MKLLTISLLICCAPRAHASIAEGTTVSVGTVAANGTGITISSRVYLSPNSQLTLQSSGGYITTTSSITGSSFWGDGTNLSGVGLLSATQTFSGANSFSSSFTARSGGRVLVISTSATMDNIRINSSGESSFYPELHNSSSTTFPLFSTTNNSFGPCVTGSSLTIQTSGGVVEVVIQTTVSISSDGICGGWNAGINFLQDGQFVGDLSSGYGPGFISPSSCDASVKSVRISYLLTPSAGLHSYCLTVSAIGGVHATTVGQSVAANMFYVKELK